MISLANGKKRYANPPNSLKHVHTRTKINKIIVDAPNHKITSGYNSAEVRIELRKYHGDKCIYCESNPIGSSAFRVDHYRPKKYIKELSETQHYGYYWLALEWSNLVQSCESCNGKKSNSFPVDSVYVNALKKEPHITGEAYRKIDVKLLKNERRLLLHPELDVVEKHLKFIPNGKVEPINKSKMGESSIKIYGLNRPDLVWRRKQKIDNCYNELIGILNDFEDRGGDVNAKLFLNHDLDKYFKKLLKAQSEENEYSRLSFYMFHDFKTFIISRLPIKLDEHIILLENFHKSLISIQ